MPARPAMAGRWIIALVDPPRAIIATIALWNDTGLRICEGRGPSTAMATERRPAAAASLL